jgi:hypothetical protein
MQRTLPDSPQRRADDEFSKQHANAAAAPAPPVAASSGAPAPSAPSPRSREQRAEPVAEPPIESRKPGGPNAGETTEPALQSQREESRMQSAPPEAKRERARIGADASKALAEPRADASPPAPRPQTPRSAHQRFEPNQEQADTVLTPQQWLREIEQLRREGREELARIRLDQFRKRFPEYPLPESLQ